MNCLIVLIIPRIILKGHLIHTVMIILLHQFSSGGMFNPLGFHAGLFRGT